MHFEYPLGGANQGRREISCVPDVVIHAMKKDLGVLKHWLKQAELI